MKYFLTDVRQGYRELTVSSPAELATFEENEPFNIDDVIDEIFDMLNNTDGKHLTLKDFEISRVRICLFAFLYFNEHTVYFISFIYLHTTRKRRRRVIIVSNMICFGSFLSFSLIYFWVIKHLSKIQQSHTAIAILADVYGFISYDQREQNMHSQDPQDEQY